MCCSGAVCVDIDVESFGGGRVVVVCGSVMRGVVCTCLLATK